MFDMNQDAFDSRDVIERIEELEALEEAAQDSEATVEDIAEFTEELEDELSKLRAFVEDAENVSDWHYGETFIADHYFTTYVEELITDCGYIPADLPGWIASNIDWEGVADELKVDYTYFELDGNTYWAR